MAESKDVSPGIRERTVIFPGGRIEEVPEDWDLLPPGDAGLTRRVKAAVPSWTMKEKKGRRTFSKGVYADKATIERIRTELDAERSTDAYVKKQASAKKSRDKKQEVYVDSFRDAVLSFLKFDERYDDVADLLATAVTNHATPVGSGTVARTERIPVEQRAESAVIAWMRHQTTAYDDMKIARVKGKRREVRRMLAEESRRRLQAYRQGARITESCPLKKALADAA